MKKLMMIMVVCLGAGGMQPQYIMSTKDGKMITTDSKPKPDESTGMYHTRCRGRGGHDQAVTMLPRSWRAPIPRSGKEGCPGQPPCFSPSALPIWRVHLGPANS